MSAPKTKAWGQLVRLLNGTTQREVAERTGINQRSLSAYKHRLARPSAEAAEALEVAYGIDRLDWLTPAQRREREQRLAALAAASDAASPAHRTTGGPQ